VWLSKSAIIIIIIIIIFQHHLHQLSPNDCSVLLVTCTLTVAVIFLGV